VGAAPENIPRTDLIHALFSAQYNTDSFRAEYIGRKNYPSSSFHEPFSIIIITKPFSKEKVRYPENLAQQYKTHNKFTQLRRTNPHGELRFYLI